MLAFAGAQTMFSFRRSSASPDVPQSSLTVPDRHYRTEGDGAEAHAAHKGTLSEDLSAKMAALGREYDAFTERFSADLGKIGRHFSKISSDNQLLVARNEKLSREQAALKDSLTAAGTRAESLEQERVRLTAELALIGGKLTRSLEEHRADRELLASLQMRNEALDNDYSRVLVERDKYQNELISTRYDLNEFAQKYEQVRIKLEQAENRFSSLEVRNRLLEVDVQNYVSEIDSYKRSAGESGEKASLYTNDLAAANERISQIEVERDALAATRERLSAQCAAYVTKIEEMRRQFDASMDGLSRTKAFLWENSEKQRRQMADQAARISQLEQSNSNLTKLLSESHYAASRNTSPASDVEVDVSADKIVNIRQ